MNSKWLWLSLVLALASMDAQAAEKRAGYQARAMVSAPTRLDWTFILSNRSMPAAAAKWVQDYDSTTQTYELFVPPNPGSTKRHPLVLFISPSAEPMGWNTFELACKQFGMIFVGPRDAGNDCPGKKRVRIVMDVFDDVCRKHSVDPDRIYLAGISGGARIACGIGFALPEYFGGMIPICGGGDLRTESWLRQRVIDRLSVAYVTGETDFNRGEVERYRGPVLKEVGVRSKVWVYPRLGHAMPTPTNMIEVIRWLEGGVDKRRELAKHYPAARVSIGQTTLTREAWSAALLEEAKQRLRKKATMYSGLMDLQGCSNRWMDLDAGKEAQKLLQEYDAQTERPWEENDIAEQRLFLVAEARGLDAYASGPLPDQYVEMRASMIKQAMQLWEIVLKDGADTGAGQEAKKRLPVLQKLLKKE